MTTRISTAWASALLGVGASLVTMSAADKPVTVPQWGMFETALTSSGPYTNAPQQAKARVP